MAKRKKTESAVKHPNDPSWDDSLKRAKKRYGKQFGDTSDIDKMMRDKLIRSSQTVRPVDVEAICHFTVGELIRNDKGRVIGHNLFGDATMVFPDDPMDMPKTFQTFFKELRMLAGSSKTAIAGGHVVLQMPGGHTHQIETGVPVGDSWASDKMDVEGVAMLTFGKDILRIGGPLVKVNELDAFYWMTGCSASLASYVTPDGEIAKAMGGAE